MGYAKNKEIEEMNKHPPQQMKKGIIPFGKDFHPEFEGYIGAEGEGVWISAIHSKEQGKGNFSRLLTELKGKYEWIKIPTPSNTMRLIALTHGFTDKREYFPPPFDEWGEILYWKKEELDRKDKRHKQGGTYSAPDRGTYAGSP